MDDSMQKLIEQYSRDLMRFHGAHGGAPAAPREPGRPDPPDKPEPAVRPDFPPEIPGVPAPAPEIPARPPAVPEMPDVPAPAPEMPSPPVPTPEIRASEPDRRQNDLGFLQVRTYTAREATPVPDALVLVLQEGQLVRQTLTDEDGLTELIGLDTVGRDLSMTEGTAEPFTTYTVQISAEGYLPVVSRNVPVFGGVTAIQNVGLIPLPEFDADGPDEVVENTEPDL